MGGTKKKSLGASSKSQEGASPQGQTEKKEEKKKGEKQQKSKITVILDEKQSMKSIPGLKAVTPTSLAKNLGVKISVANAFIRSLEAKGTVRRVGGYSGHMVYELLEQPKMPSAEKEKETKAKASDQ
jgi:small subunit ribosomal protein S25e